MPAPEPFLPTYLQIEVGMSTYACAPDTHNINLTDFKTRLFVLYE